MSYLLDTDTCSLHLRRDPSVTSKVVQNAAVLSVSVITVGELFTWALRAKTSPKRLRGAQDLLHGTQVLEVTHGIARKFGEVHAALLDQGRPTPPIDLFIACTALVRGLTVVTHNTKDFAHIPGLTIEDWTIP